LHDAAAQVWEKIGAANAYLNAQEPWKQTGDAQRTTLGIAATMICHIAWLLQPFMPSTAVRIGTVFGAPLAQWEDGQKLAVRLGEPLFPRRT